LPRGFAEARARWRTRTRRNSGARRSAPKMPSPHSITFRYTSRMRACPSHARS
jgi:hypothetical protein